jgi:hypothetical protein
MVPADQVEQAKQLLADVRNSGGTQAADVAAAAAEAKG